MATPTPRSYSQVLSDLLGTFLADKNLSTLQVGNPILSIFEAAARSDVRSSQDFFNALASVDLDGATGQTLDLIGLSEDLPRFGLFPASGLITVGDSSFTKTATKIFPGLPPPIVGSNQLFVSNATGFGTSGSLYIGRGTTNAEGPLTFTGAVAGAGYWTITLAPGHETARYHNLNESVVLAHGGDRAIPAGTIVQTTQGTLANAVQFKTSYAATLPDGETSIGGIGVIASTYGVVGNVIAGAINDFSSRPFIGAIVTNPSPISNGIDVEKDDPYRERIRAARKSKRLGTDLALKTFLTGIVSPDENKRASSVSVVRSAGSPTTVYVDDGTGYEETSTGVAVETLADESTGGEKRFQLVQKPVAKASAQGLLYAPFDLSGAPVLAVAVGGVLSQHSFSDSEFRAASSASAYEVAAAINGNASLTFGARTTDAGSRVALSAKSDTNEDVEVVVPAVGVDANAALGFASGRNDSLRLYLNDRPLSKDGTIAELRSNPSGMWSPVTSPVTLAIQVDGVDVPTSPVNTYSITDQDFVNAVTGYQTVAATNSLASWAKVLNYRIPGLTARVDGGVIVLSSNKGRTAQSQLVISSCGLTTAGMFTAGTAIGADFDFQLDRSLGQLTLVDSRVLAVGDKLTVGSATTRAFLESQSITDVTFAATATTVVGETGAEFWFVVDGQPSIIATGVAAGVHVAVSPNPGSWAGGVFTVSSTVTPTNVQLVYYVADGAIFGNVAEGDWLIALDSALNIANRGSWRIVSASSTTVVVERPLSWSTPETPFLATGGMVFVRTPAQLQRVWIVNGTHYTASVLSDLFSAALSGAASSTYRTTHIRIGTNSYGTGDVALVAVNSEAAKLGFPVSVVTNNDTHLASIVAGHDETGTPNFGAETVASTSSPTSVTLAAIGQQTTSRLAVVSRASSDTNGHRFGHKGFYTPVTEVSGSTITTRRGPTEWMVGDSLYAANPYAITGDDTLGLVVDGDESSGRFICQMYRKATPGSAFYGSANDFKDAENGGASLAQVFGTTMQWNDWAIFMAARTKTHGTPDNNKTMLWRYRRLGADGNTARIQYVYPSAPSTASVTTTDALTDAYTDIAVTIPSGAARTGIAATNAMRLGTTASAVDPGGLYTYTYVFNVVIYAATRTSNITDLELELPTGATSHGLALGDRIYVACNGAGSAAGFHTGVYTITNVPDTTHIRYAETGVDIGVTSYIGTISCDTAEAKLGASNVIVGDIFSASTQTSLPSSFRHPVKISTLADGYLTAKSPNLPGGTTGVLVWSTINSTTNISAFPLSGNTIVAIAAGINAQTSSAVSAVAVGDGAAVDGTIDYASYEATPNGLGGTNPWYYLSDGVNYVRSHTTPTGPTVDFNFTFKNLINTTLATNSDWANEDVRLVPQAATHIVNYLNTPGPGALFASATIEVSGKRPQITTKSPGSVGSVQCQGGSANALVAAVKGAASRVATNYTAVTIATSDAIGLSAGHWMKAQNQLVASKVRVTSATALTSLAATGDVVWSGTKAWEFANTAQAVISGSTWQFERQGDFVAVSGSLSSSLLTGVKEGDWVHISSEISNPTHVNPSNFVAIANQGLYRVVRIDSTLKVFWIENASAVEEIQVADVAFLTYDSIVPGDKLVIGYQGWGVDNLGTWTVESIDLTTYSATNTDNNYKFKLSTAERVPVAVGPVAALGTSNAALVRVIEGSVSHLFKRVYSINPNSTDATLSVVKFDSWDGSDKLGESARTTLVSLDKLGFSGAAAVGVDGYRYNTGLVGEAAKKAFGVDSDPTTYPGIASAGKNINFSGPMVHRVTVSLSVRMRSGVAADVKSRIQSAVAAVINATSIGTSIAISDIVAAAQSVNGVVSVAVLSPSYGAGQDMISVQPTEKPMVLNVDQDVSVSFVG